MNKVFIDSAAWLALVNKNDEFHEKAKEVRGNLFKEKVGFVTTNQIIIEVANTLSKLRFKKVVVKLIESIEKSKDINVIFIDEEIWWCPILAYFINFEIFLPQRRRAHRD